jgi:HSP20 family protein
MNRVLSGTGFGPEEDSDAVTSTWAPAVDVKEDDDKYVIHADVPGVDPKDIEVTMENGILTLRGERTSESETEKGEYKRIERTHGSFYRRFTLPDTADGDKIEAKTKHGVVEIVIPKSTAKKARRIEVKG